MWVGSRRMSRLPSLTIRPGIPRRRCEWSTGQPVGCLVVFPEEGHPVVTENEMADLLGNTAARLFVYPQSRYDNSMTTKTRYYNATGWEFLARAQTYLAEGDLLQASEKGWGAAAQMVKSIAEARGWPHGGHHQLWRAVNRLADETGDRDIRTAFGLAGALHTNFYEGWLPPETVEDYLAHVSDLLSKLEPLAS